MTRAASRTVEFGDFQTPLQLARKACSVLLRKGISPLSVLEPTCGRGAFLQAAVETFPAAKSAIGVDVNPEYVADAQAAMAALTPVIDVRLVHGDFFHLNWGEILERLASPVLIVGNPPWVTNDALACLESGNLPQKSNADGLRGIDAITGQSNFDISEWMLRRSIDWLNGRTGTLAVLCKTSVARKVMRYAWTSGAGVQEAEIYRIDSRQEFGVAVDACLLVVSVAPGGDERRCAGYDSLDAVAPSGAFGLSDGHLVADPAAHERWKEYEGRCTAVWRSGVKHDCRRVFELQREGSRFRNGLGETVDLEAEMLFPMLKSSDIASGNVAEPARWMLITQRRVGDDTRHLRMTAPRTWQYLERHADLLKRRKSAIYRGKPPFAIFGVGEYTFAPWKVAIAGLYKRLQFCVVPPHGDLPIILDDTAYFVPCYCEAQAREIVSVLRSDIAQGFYTALIFWDAKRPITARLLNRLDLFKVARDILPRANLSWMRDMAMAKNQTEQGIPRQTRLFGDSTDDAS